LALQEGLKAHESGQHHANPFDVFSNFFGGGRESTVIVERAPLMPIVFQTSNSKRVAAQVR
jgi:DnaJ-related protein SCJ1